ncbi:MAG: c-type cytochrome [Rhizobiales bacterium]|nr:c-type cytochrome [Hyphomicrobiales bacterium]
MHNQSEWPTQFQSNGERIYFTGTSTSGGTITAKGGGRHMRMMGGACANCHGADRLGGRMMPQFWLEVPPLTSYALFGGQEVDDHGSNANESESDHGNHDFYTDETLGRAIAQGIDPSGKSLNSAMPRWSISSSDLVDLIAYLRNHVQDGQQDDH